MRLHCRTPVPRTAARLVLMLVFALSAGAGMRAQPSIAATPSATANLQGDQRRWINDPHTRAFYDLTVAAFALGPAALNKAKYHEDCRRLFRDFGPSMGLSPAAMEEHLKLIPDQVIAIVTEDPSVLSNFDRFVAALFGPQ